MTDDDVRGAIYRGAWPARSWVWGQTDCCQFTRDIVTRLHGRDPMAEFPAYTSEDEALACMPNGLQDAVTCVLGIPSHTHEIGRPALVSMPAHQPVLGVTISTGVLVRTAVGLLTVPAHRIVCEWEI